MCKKQLISTLCRPVLIPVKGIIFIAESSRSESVFLRVRGGLAVFCLVIFFENVIPTRKKKQHFTGLRILLTEKFSKMKMALEFMKFCYGCSMDILNGI